MTYTPRVYGGRSALFFNQPHQIWLPQREMISD